MLAFLKPSSSTNCRVEGEEHVGCLMARYRMPRVPLSLPAKPSWLCIEVGGGLSGANRVPDI